MKHNNVALAGDILKNVWDDDDFSVSEHAEIEIESDKYYLVMWPEHVRLPSYNGDCAIHGPFNTEAEAMDYRPNTVAYR